MRKFILSSVVLCLCFAAMPVFAQLEDATTVQIATDLESPIFAISPPGDYRRLFIVEREGQIQILDLLTQEVNETAFLDISDQVNSSGERGFVGLAFPDDFLDEGFFFVYYIDNTPADPMTGTPEAGFATLSRFKIDDQDGDIADETTETLLATIEQPDQDHNGGTIFFDDSSGVGVPEIGYLHWGLGDGGDLSDPDGNAQSGDTLLGKMLRIDVSDYTDDVYTIPGTNPFFGSESPDPNILDEIFHFGVRNPFRWCFDEETGDMYIADVGEVGEEEITVVESGEEGLNLGWACWEGSLEFSQSAGTDCDVDRIYLDPALSYDTAFPQCAVIGGFVYHGDAIPDFDGVYIYADWCSGDMWITEWGPVGGASDPTLVTSDLAPGMGQVIDEIAGFGRDAYGELYICDFGGEIYKIIPDDFDGDDCNGNYILDSKEVEFDVALDCNDNNTIDACDVLEGGGSEDINSNDIPDECEEFPFVRSDVNGDGNSDILDLFATLEYMFEAGSSDCVDAMDFNDDGVVNLTDVFESASFTFLSGPDPAAPYPDCAEDTTEDGLNCAFHTDCNP